MYVYLNICLLCLHYSLVFRKSYPAVMQYLHFAQLQTVILRVCQLLMLLFLDMSSAFDKVVHNVLFRKLIKLNVPPTVLKLLFMWYMNSNVYVRWGAYTSYTFMLSAGVRPGGVLSPILFCIYVDCIVQRLESSKLGCWIGELYVGCILYADDLILISSSVCELQRMVDFFFIHYLLLHTNKINILYK